MINSNLKSLLDTQKMVENLENHILNDLGVSVSLYFNNWEGNSPAIRLASIKVPKEKRNQGFGTKAMQKIVAFADENEMKIFLTPVNDWGSNIARLTKFYKSLGFLSNAGKNKDWHYKESMVRLPKLKKMNEILRSQIRKYCRHVVLQENNNENINYDVLPDNILDLVKKGMVTYRGQGFGGIGWKIRINKKEYNISDETFDQLRAINKIPFNAPYRTEVHGEEVWRD